MSTEANLKSHKKYMHEVLSKAQSSFIQREQM